MKKTLSTIILLLSFGSLHGSNLRVYQENKPEKVLYETSNQNKIRKILQPVNVRFEQWNASKPLPKEFQQKDVLDAYKGDVDRLCKQFGYQFVDVVRMNSNTPGKEALRKKFLREHRHGEDEVRFFVEGSGLFALHIKDKVYLIVCEKGDLLGFPAGYKHWFDMGENPFFTTIRFFTTKEGWIADFTENGIAANFPTYVSKMRPK